MSWPLPPPRQRVTGFLSRGFLKGELGRGGCRVSRPQHAVEYSGLGARAVWRAYYISPGEGGPFVDLTGATTRCSAHYQS